MRKTCGESELVSWHFYVLTLESFGLLESGIIILDDDFDVIGHIDLPDGYKQINEPRPFMDPQNYL